MKRPFRFFRGEFMTGFYLKTLFRAINVAVEGILSEVVYHAKVQWKLEHEVEGGEHPMRDADILGIGTVAGLFPLRTVTRTTLGSIDFTSSHVVDRAERSERGLMDMDWESFRYVRGELDDYPTDISTAASPARRMGHRDEEAVLAGYVREGTPLYAEDGEVIWGNLLDEPPDGEAYVPFYGEKYLVFREYFTKKVTLPIDVYKLLLECCQRIRFNGATLGEFFTVTALMGEGYMHDIEIVPDESHRWYNVFYDLDEGVLVLNRERRYLTWIDICRYKFKLFRLVNRESGGGQKERPTARKVLQLTFDVAGDDHATVYAVRHNLGSRDVHHEFYDAATGGTVPVEFTRISVNDARLRVGKPLGGGNTYRLIVRAETDVEVENV